MYCITEMTHALDLFPKESIIILNKFISKQPLLTLNTSEIMKLWIAKGNKYIT